MATPEDLPVVTSLFRMYFDELRVALDLDIAYQDLENELADPWAKFERVWLTPRAEGVVALRRLPDGRPEMKRLYVRPEARGEGWADRLCAAVEEYARDCGDAELLLDSVDRLEAAARLYARRGYRRASPYIENPFADAAFYSVELSAFGSSVT